MITGDSWLDKALREAEERGDFDNLPGKGKPLDLDRNPYEDPEWEMANHLLRNAGFAQEWIEMDREIRQRAEAARRGLARSREWREARLAEVGDRRELAAQQAREHVADEWRRAVERFEAAVVEINRQIALFNLKAPVSRLQRLKLDAAREIELIESVE